MTTTASYSPRRCAQDILACLAKHHNDMPAAAPEVTGHIQSLLQHPGLLDLGVPRSSAHTQDSVWLYYDPEFFILISHPEKDVAVPAHNHGTWEAIGLYRGALQYSRYQRRDDGAKPGYADLAIVEERVMRPPEVSILPAPPNDIHGFTGLADDTYILAVSTGAYSPVRLYYNPLEKTYTARPQYQWNTARSQG